MSKILCMMTVKNEVDIIDYTISLALNWADYIIVMDNNSTDGTWEKLNELALNNRKMIIWGRFYGKFKDSLRQRIFQDYKYLASNGDWWCRLDADEEYIDDPRVFLKSVKKNVDFVNSASFQYYLTENDKENNDISELKYYSCNWSETRFIKHQERLVWPSATGWPLNLSVACDDFIRVKHYQYRSLEQLAKRVKIRKDNTQIISEFSHEKQTDSEWYLSKSFTPPDDVNLMRSRIVLSTDLKSDLDYIIPESFKYSFKQTLRNRIMKSIRKKIVNASYFLINRYI